MFRETQIGRIVNRLSKQSAYADVRNKCAQLVQLWKQQVSSKEKSGHQKESPEPKRIRLSAEAGTGPCSNKAEGTQNTGMQAIDEIPRTDDTSSISSNSVSSSAVVSDKEYLRRFADMQRQVVPDDKQFCRGVAAKFPRPIQSTFDERRQALREGGERGLLREVECYLLERQREASINDINAHIQRIWSGTAKVVVDLSKRRVQGDAPFVGKKFVERHADHLKLKDIYKATPLSRKSMHKGYHVGTHVQLLR